MITQMKEEEGRIGYGKEKEEDHREVETINEINRGRMR